MSKERPTVSELRERTMRSRRSSKVMAWFCGIQSIIGAVSILLTNGAWGWWWFILGFIFMFVYVGLVVFNDVTLRMLKGLDDDE